MLDRTFRRTKDAIKILGARVLRALLYYKLDTIYVYFKGVRYVRFLIMRELLYGKQIFLVNCFDISGVPHNGCRIRKNRRFKRRNKKIMR